MSKKQLEQREKDFCRIYLDTMDVCRAAERAGVGDGFELLRRKDVQQYLKQMRKSMQDTVQTGDVLHRLYQIAFSRPNDAVALACGQQCGSIAGLDLAAVAEFKRKDEQIEVKFLDRVRALQVLGELLSRADDDHNSAALDFFQALEQSAAVPMGEEGA